MVNWKTLKNFVGNGTKRLWWSSVPKIAANFLLGLDGTEFY